MHKSAICQQGGIMSDDSPDMRYILQSRRAPAAVTDCGAGLRWCGSRSRLHRPRAHPEPPAPRLCCDRMWQHSQPGPIPAPAPVPIPVGATTRVVQRGWCWHHGEGGEHGAGNGAVGTGAVPPRARAAKTSCCAQLGWGPALLSPAQPSPALLQRLTCRSL